MSSNTSRRWISLGFGSLVVVIVAAIAYSTPPPSPMTPDDEPGPPLPTPTPQNYDRTLYIDPIPGLTTSRHPAPAEFQVPVGTTLRFRQYSPSGYAYWSGATQIGAEDSFCIAECPIPTAGEYDIRTAVHYSPGDPWVNNCKVTAVDVSTDAVSLRHVAVEAGDVGLSEEMTNEQTMEHFFGQSIAEVSRVRAKRGPAKPTAPRRYRTSVERPIEFSIATDPPGFEPLMEARIEGKSSFLPHPDGYVFDEPGVFAISVGPPSRQRRLDFEVYKVTITSHVSGEDTILEDQPITFTAVSDPPGYEDEITWISSTKYGTGIPITGRGPTFTVQFDDTFRPDDAFQWLGVKADNAVFNQDQKLSEAQLYATAVPTVTPSYASDLATAFGLSGTLTEDSFAITVNNDGGTRFLIVYKASMTALFSLKNSGRLVRWFC